MPRLCPQCNEEIEHLDYKGEYSEVEYGRSSGTYSLPEIGEEINEGDYECEDTNSTDHSDWEESEYTYYCPHCHEEVDLDDIEEGEAQEEEEEKYKFKIGEAVMHLTVGLRQQKWEEMVIQARKWQKHNAPNKAIYRLRQQNGGEYWATESKLHKKTADIEEWTHNTIKNSSQMVNGQIRNEGMDTAGICKHCSHVFLRTSTGNRFGIMGTVDRPNSVDSCPKCNKPMD